MARGDDSYILVRDRGVILVDEEGHSTHMIGAIRNITPEREAERAQREAADLYHTLFAQAVNPAYHIAADGRFLDANDAGSHSLPSKGNSYVARASQVCGEKMRRRLYGLP